MILHRLLKRFLRPMARPQRSRKTFRPSVEFLEERAVPAVFTVTTTTDGSTVTGSLPWAIQQSDANPGATNTINFDIGPSNGASSNGQAKISLTFPLPTLTVSTIIDGTSQPGWAAGTPTLLIDGTGLASGLNALTVNAPNCTIRGIQVQNASNGDGICLYSNDNVIEGDTILGCDSGVEVTNGAQGNMIGGPFIVGQNVIDECSQAGIALDGDSSHTTVEGDFIGSNSDFGASGIEVETGSGDNTIGPAANLIGYATDVVGNYYGINVGQGGPGNVIQNCEINQNMSFGVILGGNGNSVLDNSITFNMYGLGIGGSNNVVGGPGAGNQIDSNAQAGILQSDGIGNKFSQNSITGNGPSQSGPGIDLLSGVNDNQAAPVLSSATLSGTTMTVKGTLTSAPNTAYALEFFANPGRSTITDPEGDIYLFSFKVTTAANGTASFDKGLTVPAAYSSNTPIITATTTDPSGDTSQFSAGVLDPAKPAAPVLVATTLSASQIGLFWNSVLFAQGYLVDRLINGVWTQIARLGSTATSYTASQLADATKYSFRVCAYDAEGITDSSAARATTLLAAVTHFMLTPISASQIDLFWSNDPRASGYLIEEEIDGAWQPIASPTARKTSYHAIGLTADTDYSFMVIDYDASNSADSSALTAATLRS
jgi:hypothetical protein